MFKIILYILLVATITNGKGRFCDCSCEGTKLNNGIPLCDKITKKCECKPGFTGESCQRCIDVIPSTRSCRSCDCPNANNKCKQKTSKFYALITKFKTLNDTDFISQPTVNISQINDFKLKLEKLLTNINENQKVGTAPLKKLAKEAKKSVEDIRELLKKYNNEDLIKEDEEKLKQALNTANGILNTIKDIEEQGNINEISKNANKIGQNITDILNDHSQCLDIIEQFCSVKNTSQSLKEVNQAVDIINLDAYFNRVNKSKRDVDDSIRVDKINRNNLEGIQIPLVPKFDEKAYMGNHEQLERINERIKKTDNATQVANDLYGKTKKKKEESDLEKFRARNTILMAPVEEIQEIIDNVTSTIYNSSNLFNEITANKTKLEDTKLRLESDLKSIEQELEGFQKRTDKIETELNFLVPDPDTYDTYVEAITKMKENLLNLTAEYKNKRDEYQQFEKEMEEDFEKMKTVLETETECINQEAEEVDQKIQANDGVLDGLEHDLDIAEQAVILLKKVEDFKAEVKIVKEIRDDLDKIKDEDAKIICTGHSLV